MNHNETLLIRNMADIFRQEKEDVLQIWLGLVKQKNYADNDIEYATIKECFAGLIDDFITFLSTGDFDGYFNSNEGTGIKLALQDISYRKFIEAFHLFEDSYMHILVGRYSGEDLTEYLCVIDKVHHKTIAIVTEAFFKVKDSTVDALINLSELRDDTTGSHMDRTRKYLVILAEEMDLDQNFTYQLVKAGPLHDVGKIAIPDSILLKPGRLTDEEFEQMKKHTIIGAQAIERIYEGKAVKTGYLLMARDIAMYHHEKYNGTGYPEGLKGQQIPLPARIFALVDAYDAMVSKRPYKEPLSHEITTDRILHDSGSHFDPRVVESFLKVQMKFKEVMQYEMKNMFQ